MSAPCAGTVGLMVDPHAAHAGAEADAASSSPTRNLLSIVFL
jgi:hypothetical protein